MTGKFSTPVTSTQTDTTQPTPATDPTVTPADGNAAADSGGATEKNILSEHKGKLAIGVAATLGLMIYYKWREKSLSKEDPEAYARLQRIKDSVRADDTGAKPPSNAKRRDSMPKK
jgi:hypothetical protein